MALDKQMAQPEQATLSSEEEEELKVMVNLAETMIDEGGFKVIEQALSSKDPGTIIGQFLMQLGSQLGEKLPFEISPRIMLAEGGWVEEISDYLQDEYDVPQKVMDRAEIFVGSSAQAMAQSAGQQGGQAAPQEAAAPAEPPVPQEMM